MDVTQDQSPAAAGEPLGAGWRTASWMAFALAVIIASQVMTTKAQDATHGAVLALGALLMMFVSGLGLLFAIFGVAATDAGDRRVAVILPAIGNGILLLWIVATIFAP